MDKTKRETVKKAVDEIQSTFNVDRETARNIGTACFTFVLTTLNDAMPYAKTGISGLLKVMQMQKEDCQNAVKLLQDETL